MSTSFNRSNVFYQSLPINTATTANTTNGTTPSSTKNVNFKPTTTNEMSTSSSSSDSKFQSSINTEEFAKLDALLEDLLAEVDQPILLNHKEITTSKTLDLKRSTQRSPYNPHQPTQQNHNQVDRSVDWLNEQKEILRARKEAAAAQQPYRKIKSKIDYYITNSNGDGLAEMNGGGGGGGELIGAQIPIINNKPPVSPCTRQLYSPNTTTTMTNVTQIPIHQQQQQQQQHVSHTSSNTSNTPVVVCSSNPSQLGNSFRSLSNNPALLVK